MTEGTLTLRLRAGLASLAQRSLALVPPDALPPVVEPARDFVRDVALARERGFDASKLELPDEFTEVRQAWNIYVRDLVAAFAAATGSSLCRVRLARTSGDECRLFHCDLVRVRLFQTLAGPGTEYLDEDNVRRDGLGRGSNALVVRDAGRVRHAPTGDLLLMRGERWRTGGGCVHRSPPIAHLRLDPALGPVVDPAHSR